MANRNAVTHLLRRATFGPTSAEVDAAERAGPEATLTALLVPTGNDAGALASPLPALGPDPYAGITRDATPEQRRQAGRLRGTQVRDLTYWWLDRMVAAEHQLVE